MLKGESFMDTDKCNALISFGGDPWEMVQFNCELIKGHEGLHYSKFKVYSDFPREAPLDNEPLENMGEIYFAYDQPDPGFRS